MNHIEVHAITIQDLKVGDRILHPDTSNQQSTVIEILPMADDMPAELAGSLDVRLETDSGQQSDWLISPDDWLHRLVRT